MTFLEWRKLNFFDLHPNVDGGKVAEVLEDTNIAVCTSGHFQLVIGDDTGKIHLFSKTWGVVTFKAYENKISHAIQLRHDPCLITVGEDEIGIKAVIKVWDSSPKENDRVPCLRVTKLSRIRASPTSLAVHDNKNLMALGFDDGLVILFRGDITRKRSIKEIELRTKSTDLTEITGLAFSSTSHLFVASRSSVNVFNITSSGKERGSSLDEAKGCQQNCSVLVHDQQFVVARNKAIYCYNIDGRRTCYPLMGLKRRVDWFRSYLVAISKENEQSKIAIAKDDKSQNDHLTILDLQNKFIVFSMALKEIKAVLTEWGSFYIITEDKQVHHLDEKDLQTKLTILFKKNLFDVAIRIASSHKYDSERLIDIYTQYADHLFKKSDPKGAIEQYIKTIGRLETSYVIKKYLESRHLEPLTYYLQELHKVGLATEDHTTLLLTCFVKLDQHDQHGKLKEFINARDRAIDFNVEIAIKVCRQVSSDDALQLARKHNEHDWYMKIATEDKKDFLLALDYIEDLEFDSADFYMKKYGNILMQHSPNETTKFLKQLCIDFKPKHQPLVDDEMMAGIVTRNEPKRARPEEYIHLFLNNSERLVEFLEHLVNSETNWPTLIYNTLIEHHLHVWSSLSDKPDLRETYEQKVVRLLQNTEAKYDKDQTLLVCLMLNFKPGILYLYEEYKLYQQILRYHISQGDMDEAMNCCRKFGGQEPHLWVVMLWCPPPSEHLPEVLNVIANQRLMSPLLVLDCITNSTTCTLADVRKYLINVLSEEENVTGKEAAKGDQLRKQSDAIRNELKEAISKPMICQASRCSACSQQLELPSKHFLCNHSYHQHCIQSFSENENECPVCIVNNKQLLEVLRNQGINEQTTESFHSQLERVTDGFSVISEYFGRGIFDHLSFQTDDNSADDNSISQAESVSSLPSITSKSVKNIKPEVLNYGPGAESRIRLEESKHMKQVSLDNQRPYTPKSSIAIPTVEARMRILERNKQESLYSSSLEANITRHPPAESVAKMSTINPSNDIYDSISSKSNTPLKNSPVSLKNKKLDSVSIRSNTSSQKETKTQNLNLMNPFGDDSPYDDSKNPFGECDEDTKKTPFDDDDDDEEDDSYKGTNPFG